MISAILIHFHLLFWYLEKAKMEWESAMTVMEELMFKPHYMNFKEWIWSSASVSVFGMLSSNIMFNIDRDV